MVSIRALIEAAFCRAERVTLVGIDDAGLHQVFVTARGGVEAEVRVLVSADLLDHDRAFEAGVADDLANRLFASAADDVDADLLIAFDLESVERRRRAEQCHAAARNDAFFNRRARGMQSILDASLLFLHFGLGGRADFDDRDAARELRQAFLELLAIVIGSGLFDLSAQLLDAAFDVLGLAGAIDDGGVVFVHRDALGAAEVFELDAFELNAGLFEDRLAAGEDGDVFEHRLAAIAKARSLHGAGVQRAAQLVDDESGERFAFHFLGDDQQRLARTCDLLEYRQQVLHVADFLLVDQDVGIFEHALHALRIADEVGREVAAVELHTFDGLEFGDMVFDSSTVMTPSLPTFFIASAMVLPMVASPLAEMVPTCAIMSPEMVFECFFTSATTSFDGLLDAALQRHRIRTGRNALHAFAVDALRQNGRGGGAVAGHIGGLGGHFAHHLRAHVLERILQLDFFRDGHAVFGDGRSAELFLEDHVAALRSQRHFHRVGQLIHAAENRLAGIFGINNLFCSHG